MEDNLTVGISPYDILFMYNTGASVLLDEDFESDSTFVIGGYEGRRLPLHGSFEKKDCDFACWNTRKDGTGTDYFGGEEIRLTENTYLYAKWKTKEPVTLTYIYNGGTGAEDSEQAVPGLEFTFPTAERSGYSFKGWYENEALTVFAGNTGEICKAVFRTEGGYTEK